MGIFGSKSERSVVQLSKDLVAPLNAIALGAAGLTSMEQLRLDLETQKARLGAKMQSLDSTQRERAYEMYWSTEARVLESLFEAGATTVEVVRALQLEWVRTLELAVLIQAPLEPYTPRPGRPWTPQVLGVSFTYVERVRVNAPDDIDTFEGLMRFVEMLGTARHGLAYGGMMYADSSTVPISPTWAALKAGALHEAGSAVAAGWPSHRVLDLPEVLDVGAVDGRNSFLWTEPRGLSMPNSNVYVGNVEEQYFEPTRIAGSVHSIAMDSTGSRAAVVESWGGSDECRVAVVDLSSGSRTYLWKPDEDLSGASLQFSPGDQWLLVSSWRGLYLLAVDGSWLINVPFAGFDSASWWSARSVSTLAVIFNTEAGPHLAAFDLSTGLRQDLGPIVGSDPSMPADRRYYADLKVHPSRSVALVGAREGPSAAHQEKHGSCWRVAELDLDSRRVRVLRAPFFDDNSWFERDHSSWQWVEAHRGGQVSIIDSLMQQGHRPTPADPPAISSYVSDDAGDLTIFTAKALVDHMDDVHCLRAEVLRAFEANQRFGGRPTIAEWLSEFAARNKHMLRQVVAECGQDPNGWPRFAHGIQAFDAALDCLLAGEFDLVQWAEHRNT